MDKVKAIRDIRRDAQAMVEKNKEGQYQLAYLLNLFPNLEDVIDAEFSQLPAIEVSELSDYDSVRDYLSKEEYAGWNWIRDEYLKLKNRNESNKNKHSFSLYIEATNNIYNQINQ